MRYCWAVTCIFLVALTSFEACAGEVDLAGIERGLVKNQLPLATQNGSVSVVPFKLLYTIPAANYIEYSNNMEKRGLPGEAQVLYLSEGVFDLARLHRLINNNEIFRKVDNKIYISYLPIFLAANATLVVSKQELRLSLPHAAFVMYQGDFYVSESIITSWDENSASYGKRANVNKDNVLLFGQQLARPYLTGIAGSTSYFEDSEFVGLGYQGRSSSFGISLSSRVGSETNNPLTLHWATDQLTRPTGYLIGNTIRQCFFGFFSKNADDVYLVGNVFFDNLVYNIDPHDYSNNLVIARNVSYKARFSHGIILSRSVNNSFVVDNLVFSNAGSGIMLDRSSEGTNISGNIVFANHQDGIAVFESADNSLDDNLVFANLNNGVVIRNSVDVSVANNQLVTNGGFGIEVVIQDLSAHLSRNLTVDPYRQLTKASLLSNRITENLKAAIETRSQPYVWFKNNDMSGSGARMFGAELNPHGSDIITANKQAGYQYCPGGRALCVW